MLKKCDEKNYFESRSFGKRIHRDIYILQIAAGSHVIVRAEVCVQKILGRFWRLPIPWEKEYRQKRNALANQASG